MTKKTLFLGSCLLLILLGLNAWTWSIFAESRQRSADTVHDVIYACQLADDIKRLKNRPAIAGSHEIELTELSKRIEQAATAASISPEGLVQISPEAARPIDAGEAPNSYGASADTAQLLYLEKPTTVLLSGVTLRQLTSFLYDMGTGPASMDARTLRL